MATCKSMTKAQVIASAKAIIEELKPWHDKYMAALAELKNEENRLYIGDWITAEYTCERGCCTDETYTGQIINMTLNEYEIDVGGGITRTVYLHSRNVHIRRERAC